MRRACPARSILSRVPSSSDGEGVRCLSEIDRMTPAQRVEAEIRSDLAAKLRQDNRDYAVWKISMERRLGELEKRVEKLERTLEDRNRGR